MARSGKGGAAAVPLSATRAVRLALARAAERSVGLTCTVSSVGEELCDLDALTGALEDGWLIHGLERDGTLAGCLTVDPSLLAAIGEVQTTGRVQPAEPAPRVPTACDAALIAPLLSDLLREMSQTTARTTLDGWADGLTLARRIATPREAGLDLPERDYRLIRVAVELAEGARTGALSLALPVAPGAVEAPRPARIATEAWEAEFGRAVRAAPARLDAVLHRFEMTLERAGSLEVGQVIALPGCTVDRVRLVAPDGRTVLNGRLGHVAGQLAVRLEEAGPLQIAELGAPARADAAGLPGPGAAEG